MLFDRGVIGVFCVVLFVFVIYLYRSKEKAETAHQNEIKELNKQHQEQMKIFLERHATKAETWAQQGADMSIKFNAAFEKFNTTIEALAKRGGKQS